MYISGRTLASNIHARSWAQVPAPHKSKNCKYIGLSCVCNSTNNGFKEKLTFPFFFLVGLPRNLDPSRHILV